MAIKKFSDYDRTRGYAEGEQLPRGGYVCRVMGAKIIENQYGQSIKIAYDVAEGEYKDYFQRRYDANTSEDRKWPGIFLLNVPTDDGTEQDGWTKRRFKTFVEALEESNEGYHFDWDETKFKGKLVGLIMNYRQYETGDRVGFAPNPAKSCGVTAIREGKYKIPPDKPLKRGQASGQSGTYTAVETEEIPF